MIKIEPSDNTAQDNYKLLTGLIVPRPIAFVTTLSKEGVVNGAPFSFFNVVTSNPPLISLSIQSPNGNKKDTARNILKSGEFVVHITTESNVAQINEASASLPPSESEIDLVGMTLAPSDKVQVPGVKEALVRLECILEKEIPLGGTNDLPACSLMIGRVVQFHISESLYDHGRIKVDRLRAVSKLAGPDYAKMGEIFPLVRPE